MMRALWAMTKICALVLIFCKSLKVFKEENDVICLILGPCAKWMGSGKNKCRRAAKEEVICKRHQKDDGGLTWWWVVKMVRTKVLEVDF